MQVMTLAPLIASGLEVPGISQWNSAVSMNKKKASDGAS